MLDYQLIARTLDNERKAIARINRHADDRKDILKARQAARRQQFALWWSQIRQIRVAPPALTAASRTKILTNQRG